MKIVVLDGYTLNPGDLDWGQLNMLGDLTVYDRTPRELVVERIGSAELILTNKVVIDKELLEACPKLKYIGVLATGFNVVDIKEAKNRGVVVTNIPAYSTDSVAQMVFGFILSYCNRIESHTQSVSKGEWTNCNDFSYTVSPQIELKGKTLGIIGFGKIGQRIAEIAKVFGMKVRFNNRSNKQGLVKGIKQVDLVSLLTESDFVSLNCPLTDENAEFVNEKFLSLMKSSAVLINTGRGGLINEQELANSLNNKRIAFAALDVLSTEPPMPDNPLLTAKNCFITPHIGWATIEARQRLMDIAVANVKSFITGAPENVVS